jgi:hypothetical protein
LYGCCAIAAPAIVDHLLYYLATDHSVTIYMYVYGCGMNMMKKEAKLVGGGGGGGGEEEERGEELPAPDVEPGDDRPPARASHVTGTVVGGS